MTLSAAVATLLAWAPLISLTIATVQPTAKTRNGTYGGVYLPTWSQDAFLGIPFAQPPTGPLRFRHPQPLNESFSPEIRNATTLGHSCIQYAGNAFTENMSEDCLNLNVVRPSRRGSTFGTQQDKLLPVLVWIYGGGLYSGSIADPQYNLSGIVRVSQDIGEPIVGVEMNYRLGMYGFLQTPALLEEGSSNAGLLDQRLALEWVRENIAAFGGDPERVVVWGESAGAQSIAYHMVANDGQNNGLFRGAILESGGPTGAQIQDLSYYAPPVENLTRTAGCHSPNTKRAVAAREELACLRSLSQEDLLAARPSQVWNPLIDGTYLTGYPSQLLRDGKFLRIPLLTGHNTDEGSSFSMTDPKVDSDSDLFNALLTWRMYALSPPTIRKLLRLYPNDPCHEPPHSIRNCSVFPDKGLQWRRSANIGGDMVMVSGRRKMCRVYTEAGEDVFSYRFDTRPWDRAEQDGVKHFDNVAFSFQNVSGLLGPSPEFDSHMELAAAIGRAYVRFVNRLDPNPQGGKADELLPRWPRYDLRAPKNVVLNATKPWVEEDTYRGEGIAYLNSYEVARELLA